MSSDRSTLYHSVQARFADRKGVLEPRDIYLAGPFFDDHQVIRIKEVEDILKARAFTYFSPMRECRYNARTDDPEKAVEAFLLNCFHVERCRVVVAVLEPADWGTAWELGFAKGMGRPRLGVVWDTERALNLMVAQCLHASVCIDRLGESLSVAALDVVRGSRSWQAALIQLGHAWRGAQQ